MDYPAYFANAGVGVGGYTTLPNYDTSTSAPSNGALTIKFKSTDTNTTAKDVVNEYYQYCTGAITLSAISATAALSTFGLY